METGLPLVTMHVNSQSQLAPCRARLEKAITFSNAPVEALPLFYGTIFGR